jgi:predicted  nucleic acid-binding Zn-ribbon protein
VAKAYLYKEPALRGRIDMLRQQQDEARRQLAPVREHTEASTRLLVAAKDRRIRELEAHVRQLEVELAGCRGKLYERL